jgi:chorismate mutase
MTSLDELRIEIDRIDNHIIELLSERFQVCEKVIHYKMQNDIPMMQPERIKFVKERFAKKAVEKNIPSLCAHALIDIIISTACDFELEIQKRY